jgi:hypothetical protein
MVIIAVWFVLRTLKVFVSNGIRTGRVGFRFLGLLRVDLGFGEPQDEPEPNSDDDNVHDETTA